MHLNDSKVHFDFAQIIRVYSNTYVIVSLRSFGGSFLPFDAGTPGLYYRCFGGITTRGGPSFGLHMST